EVRGQYNYHFRTEVGRIPLNQTFSVSAGHQVTKLGTRQHQAGVFSTPGTWRANWTENMLWGRVYWDNPRAALNVPDSYNGTEIDYIGLPFNWFDWDSEQEINFVGAFSQTRLWDDRVNISLGVRNDSYDNTKLDARGTNNTASSDSGTTYSAGVVGYVTPWLGLVGNLSENFQPAAGGLAPSLYGETFGPSFGEGKSVGVRVSTLDHKYWVSLNYYDDEAKDVIGGDKPDFQGIWNQYFDAGGTNTDMGPAGNVTGEPGNYNANMQYEDTYEAKYTGWEFEMTLNPTKNIRIQAHYAKPEGVRTNNSPRSARYFAEKLPIWQQAAGGSTPESATLATSLANAQSLIDAVSVESITSNLAKSHYNVFAAYTFLDGALQGFEAGGGIAGLGEQYRGPNDKINGERILSPSYNTWTLFLGYSTEFDAMNREVQAKFQLNVDNLFNEDRLIFLGYQSYGDGQAAPIDYRYLNPREVTFTASFSF
ncbi:MAG: hypothetical protein ACREIA_00160, partial [Opitutaceae bacterium]